MKSFPIDHCPLEVLCSALLSFCKNSVCMKMIMEHWWNDTDRSELTYWEKTCSNATLCTTNPTWMAPAIKSGSPRSQADV